jgi:hypothetical protein
MLIIPEEMPSPLLLVALLVSHYLADFCLTLPVMIRAKADGRRLWPIALHAAVHAALMGLCLMVYGMSVRLLMALMALELVTHFAIDVAKARLSARFPFWSDIRQKPYWMLYGFDQLLHQMVVIAIWCMATNL